MSSSPNNSENTLNINSVNTTNNINEVEKPIKKHNNQYTKMKEQEQESQGIEDFELPKSVVTRLSKEAVSYCANKNVYNIIINVNRCLII